MDFKLELKNYIEIVNEELKKYIKTNVDKYKIAEKILKACEGSIGKVKKICENKEIYEDLERIFNNIEMCSLLDIMPKLEFLYKSKDEIQEILEYLNTIFINKAKENKKYIEYIKYIEETKNNINSNCNYDMCIDSLIFKIFN